MTIKSMIIFLQDIRPFEAVGNVGFPELVQRTTGSRLKTSRHYTMFTYYVLLRYLIKQYVYITADLCFVFIIT